MMSFANAPASNRMKIIQSFPSLQLEFRSHLQLDFVRLAKQGDISKFARASLRCGCPLTPSPSPRGRGWPKAG